MILLADLHLSATSAPTVAKVFETIPSICSHHRDHHVAILGDLLHHRHHVELALLLQVRQHLVDLVVGGVEKITIIPGNHDMLDRSGLTVLELFTDLPHVTVHLEPVWTDEGLWVPYRSDPEAISSALRLPRPSGAHPVLLGHLGIRGAQMNQNAVDTDGIDGSDGSDGSDGTSNGIQLVVTGHYHLQQELHGGRVIYIGSPYQVDFGEAGDTSKGYVHLEETTATFHSWPEPIGPRHHRVHLDLGEEVTPDLTSVRDGDRVWVTVSGTALPGEAREAAAQLLADTGIEGARIDLDLEPASGQARLTHVPGESLLDLAGRFLAQQEGLTDNQRADLGETLTLVVGGAA